ncbi:unnamed protein product [Phaeothamnion confervicola]
MSLLLFWLALACFAICLQSFLAPSAFNAMRVARQRTWIKSMHPRRKQVAQRGHGCVVLQVGASSSDAAGNGEAGSGRPRLPLSRLVKQVDSCYREVVVVNEGRPLGAALAGLVDAATDTLLSGYPLETVQLELNYQTDIDAAPGTRLTAVEAQFRSRWVSTIHLTLGLMGLVARQPPTTQADFALESAVIVVVEGRSRAAGAYPSGSGGDDGSSDGSGSGGTSDSGSRSDSFVKMDRGLVTRGLSGGGVATERVVVAPDCIPLSQIVLLTMRAARRTTSKT